MRTVGHIFPPYSTPFVFPVTFAPYWNFTQKFKPGRGRRFRTAGEGWACLYHTPGSPASSLCLLEMIAGERYGIRFSAVGGCKTAGLRGLHGGGGGGSCRHTVLALNRIPACTEHGMAPSIAACHIAA